MKYACRIKSREKIIQEEGLPWWKWKVEYYAVDKIHSTIVAATKKLNINILGLKNDSVFENTQVTYIFKGRRKKIKMLINILIQTFGDKYSFEKGYVSSRY